MYILLFISRLCLALIMGVSMIAFVGMDGNATAALFALALCILYAWPLFWVIAKKMPVVTHLPGNTTLTNQGALKFGRWTMGPVYAIIALTIFMDKNNAAAIPYCLMSMTLILPLDRIFFAPPGSLPDIKPVWLNAWVIVFRNVGVLVCGFNAGLLTDQHTVTRLIMAWIGLALIFVQPVVLLYRGKFRELRRAITQPPETPVSRHPKPIPSNILQTAPQKVDAAIRRMAAPSIGPSPGGSKPARAGKQKYHSAKAWQWQWPLPSTANRYPLDEPAFFQLITGFQASWLQAKEYQGRLAMHRNPVEFKKQMVEELKDYIQLMRLRPELLIRHKVLSTYPGTVGSVPDEIGKLWLSDRHIGSLYRATQRFCALPTKMAVMPFRSVAPHVAEYRAMINLIKWIEHSLRRDLANAAATVETPAAETPAREAPATSRGKRMASGTAAMPAPVSQLSDDRYFEIIDFILKLGKDFENYPELNENFNEERYRNYFLPFLNSVSPDYSAKGEVFHSKGKTDILVWDKEGTNLFIAECKIWRGEVYLLEGVTQLLTRYVNWRDEKTAILIFNREVRDFSSVIRTATNALSTHPLCSQPGVQRKDGAWSYWFHHPGDKARTIRLELILLNFVQ